MTRQEHLDAYRKAKLAEAEKQHKEYEKKLKDEFDALFARLAQEQADKTKR